METKHHLIALSRGGSNHPDNITELDDQFHWLLHQFFSNMTPMEQLAFVLKINSSAFKQEFLDLFALLLSVPQEEVYQQQCLKNVTGLRHRWQKLVDETVKLSSEEIE